MAMAMLDSRLDRDDTSLRPAASESAMDAVWIRTFILRLGIVPTINEPLNMYCDKFQGAVHYANEPGVQKAPTLSRRYHLSLRV
ncbi:hypothetical protein Tco_1216136 [Tanacetum coccineum]